MENHLVAFNSCDKRQCRNINITVDSILEGDETFSVNFTRNGDDSRIQPQNVLGVVRITDTLVGW